MGAVPGARCARRPRGGASSRVGRGADGDTPVAGRMRACPAVRRAPVRGASAGITRDGARYQSSAVRQHPCAVGAMAAALTRTLSGRVRSAVVVLWGPGAHPRQGRLSATKTRLAPCHPPRSHTPTIAGCDVRWAPLLSRGRAAVFPYQHGRWRPSGRRRRPPDGEWGRGWLMAKNHRASRRKVMVWAAKSGRSATYPACHHPSACASV